MPRWTGVAGVVGAALACGGMPSAAPPAPSPAPAVPEVRAGAAVWLERGEGECRVARYAIVRQGVIVSDREELLYGVAPHACAGSDAGWSLDAGGERAIVWGLRENEPPYGPFSYVLAGGAVVRELPVIATEHGRVDRIAWLDDGRIAAFAEGASETPAPIPKLRALPPADRDRELADAEEIVTTVAYVLDGERWVPVEGVEWITTPLGVHHSCDLELRQHAVGASSTPLCFSGWGGPTRPRPGGQDAKALVAAAGRNLTPGQWSVVELDAGLVVQAREQNRSIDVFLWRHAGAADWRLLYNETATVEGSAAGALMVRDLGSGKATFTHLAAEPRALSLATAFAARAVGR